MTQEKITHEIQNIAQDEVKYWADEIQAGERRRKTEFVDTARYETCLRYYEGKQSQTTNIASTVLDEYSTAINSILATVISRMPGLIVTATHKKALEYVTPPLLYLLQNPDFIPFLRTDLMHSSLKWLMTQEDFNMIRLLRLCGFDLLTAGFAVGECNHASEAILQPGYEQEQQPSFDRFKKGANTFMQDVKKFIGDPLGNNPESKLSMEETEQDVLSKLEYNAEGFRDWTYAERLDPRHIIFDSRAKFFHKQRCMTKEIHKSVGEFNFLYPKFKNRVPLSNRIDLDFGSGKDYEEQKGVILYQTQIKMNERQLKVLVTAKGIHEALECYALPFATDGFTYKYECLDDYGQIYPTSRATKSLVSQDSLNRLASQEMEHALRSSRKIGVFWGGLTEEGKEAMNARDVYATVPKNTPTPVFEPMPYVPVSQDNKELQFKLTDNINKNLGSTELAKSGKSDNKLLGQDMLAQQGFQANRGQLVNKLTSLGNSILGTAKDIVMQLWDGEDYFKVTGIKGGEFWYDPSMGPIADLVEGDYMASLDLIESGADRMFEKRQEADQLLGRLADPAIQEFAAARNKRVDIKPLEDFIKAFDKDPDAYLKDIEPPIPPIPPEVVEEELQNQAATGLDQDQQSADTGSPDNRQPVAVPETNGVPV